MWFDHNYPSQSDFSPCNFEIAFFISSTVIICSLPLYLHRECLIVCSINPYQMGQSYIVYCICQITFVLYPHAQLYYPCEVASLWNCHSSSYFLFKNLYGFYYLLNTQPFLIDASQTLFLMTLIA